MIYLELSIFDKKEFCAIFHIGSHLGSKCFHNCPNPRNSILALISENQLTYLSTICSWVRPFLEPVFLNFRNNSRVVIGFILKAARTCSCVMAPKPPDIFVGLSRALLLFDPDGDGECSSRTRFNGVVDRALA